jgi:hypothetical protein
LEVTDGKVIVPDVKLGMALYIKGKILFLLVCGLVSDMLPILRTKSGVDDALILSGIVSSLLIDVKMVLACVPAEGAT